MEKIANNSVWITWAIEKQANCLPLKQEKSCFIQTESIDFLGVLSSTETCFHLHAWKLIAQVDLGLGAVVRKCIDYGLLSHCCSYASANRLQKPSYRNLRSSSVLFGIWPELNMWSLGGCGHLLKCLSSSSSAGYMRDTLMCCLEKSGCLWKIAPIVYSPPRYKSYDISYSVDFGLQVLSFTLLFSTIICVIQYNQPTLLINL